MTAPHWSRRFGWLLLLATLLLWPRAGYARQQISADFDGDGQRDHATIDPSQTSVLRVWLSGTQRVGVVRTSGALLRVAALDLDGDGRPELVATAARSTGVLAWKAGRGHFKPLHKAHSSPTTAGGSTSKTVGDAPAAVDVCAASRASGDPADLEVTPTGRVSTSGCTPGVAHTDRRTASRLGVDPSVPRAPPVLTT